MKVSIKSHGYEFSKEWPELELSQDEPNATAVVHAALNVISCLFAEEQVRDAARLWTP